MRRPPNAQDAGSYTLSDIEAAFSTLVGAGATALVVTGSPFLNARRGQIIAPATRHRLAAIYENREPVTEGGLMSYGTSIPHVYRRLRLREEVADKPVQLSQFHVKF